MTGARSKTEWRRALAAARAAVSPEVRAAEAAALAAFTASLAGCGTGPVCGYLPVGTEPGTTAMLDALVAAGREVLVPVVAGRAQPLDWASYRGPAAVAAGPMGLSEPTGTRLGLAAVHRAGLILVPALAVDRRGVRLGRGGGYYDRTLAMVAPSTALVAVVRDEELVDALPAEAHDVRMTAALCPAAGLVPLALPGSECQYT